MDMTTKKDTLTDVEKRCMIEELFRAFSNRVSNNVKIKIALGKRNNYHYHKDHNFLSKVCIVLTNPYVYLKDKEKKYHNFDIWGSEGTQFPLVLADYKNINLKSTKGDAPNNFRDIHQIYLTTEFWGNEVDMQIEIEQRNQVKEEV